MSKGDSRGGGGGAVRQNRTSPLATANRSPLSSPTDLENRLSSRPISPLHPPPDQLKGYSFPSSTRTTMSPAGSPKGLPAPQRVSFTDHSRRSSRLLHEIQPPSRRLSSHQMLLLTPFGEGRQLPTAGGADMGMSRGSSSMGSGVTLPQSAPPRTGSSFGAARGDPGGKSTAMGLSPTSVLPPLASRFLRPRHQSLMSSGTQASPLGSAPMATIPSESNSSASSSREPSSQGHPPDDAEAGAPAAIHAVPMMRSNSLPIMTLRELEALKLKDGELGIMRGGDWAWLSREGELPEDAAEYETPGLSDDITASTSSSSLRSVAGSTPPSRFPFTTFSNPFASTANASGMGREGLHYSTAHPPTATIPGYHYSPTYNDTRRMSETPSVTPRPSPGRLLDPPRRPSAPGQLSTRSSVHFVGDSNPQPTFQVSGQSTRSAGSLSLAAALPFGVDPTDSRITMSTSPTRPGLMRYKSSPGRATGLGLQITVRDTPSPPSGRGSLSGGSDRRGSDRRGSSESESRRGSQTVRAARARSRQGLGSWAAVNVVESLPVELNTSPASDSSARRRSTQVHLEDSPVSFPQSTADATVVVVEQIASRARLVEFGLRNGSPEGYGQTASLSALGGGGSLGAGMAREAWVEAFPRRGSLAVLSKTPLGPWAKSSAEFVAGLGQGQGRGEPGEPEVVKASSAHWSERRGSWAEGWGKI